jgi:hypothetical protein
VSRLTPALRRTGPCNVRSATHVRSSHSGPSRHAQRLPHHVEDAERVPVRRSWPSDASFARRARRPHDGDLLEGRSIDAAGSWRPLDRPARLPGAPRFVRFDHRLEFIVCAAGDVQPLAYVRVDNAWCTSPQWAARFGSRHRRVQVEQRWNSPAHVCTIVVRQLGWRPVLGVNERRA